MTEQRRSRRARAGRPTVRDVASRAGVSPMTASRVLHGSSRVAESKRERVFAAAAQLGYRRNELARNLRLGRSTGLVGLFVTNLANPFYSSLALGAEAVAGEQGLKLVLANTGEDVQRERRLVDEFTIRRIDGMIVVPAGSDHSHLGFENVGAPVVLAATPPSNLSADCVLVDDFGGAREATARLVAEGRRRIGFVGLPAGTWTGSERFRGFCVALDEAGLPIDDRYIRRGQRTIEAAEQACLELLAMPDPPDALFCANSRNTLGAYRAVTAVAADVRLAGFDDFELADLLGIPLILVAYDPEDLGRQAARLLLNRMDKDSPPADDGPRRVVVPVTIREYSGSR